MEKRFDISFRQELISSGAHYYKETAQFCRRTASRAPGKADAILFGAMGWPDIRFPGRHRDCAATDMRIAYGLFAGVRPIRTIPVCC